MDRFMSQKYERIVLRPEINSAEITSSYLQCVKQIHARSDSLFSFLAFKIHFFFWSPVTGVKPFPNCPGTSRLSRV